MTVLNFAITQDGVFVVMDSLVTQDSMPSFFTSKAMPVPHLNGLICGTGLQSFFHRWAIQVMGGIVTFDIPHLDRFATEGLCRVWNELTDEERNAGTCTIYHFGYDRGDDEFVGFAYRSTNDFEGEQLAHGVYTKPPYRGDLPMLGFPDDFVEVCRAQRLEQEGGPADERVYIGGQIAAYMMQRVQSDGKEPSISTTIQTAYEFADFEEMYVDCLNSLPTN